MLPYNLYVGGLNHCVIVPYSELFHDDSDTNYILSFSHVLFNLGDLRKCRTFPSVLTPHPPASTVDTGTR